MNSTKSFLKIFVINLVILFLGLEVFARLFYFYRDKFREPYILNLYPEMRNYLKYVNHYRDEVFKENFLELEKRAKNKLIPINKNDYSFFIYSNYSNKEVEAKHIHINIFIYIYIYTFKCIRIACFKCFI